MINFTGYIEVEGQVKYNRVSGSYRISTNAGGMKSWSGSLKILSGEIPEFIDGVLYMEAGKSGKILITNINLPSGPVRFQGSGPLEWV
jgi:hypothetical protein